MLRPGCWWATITHMLLTREGFVCLAGREGAVCSKRIVGYATAGTHASRIGSKRPGEVAVRNCQPVKGVTIFHVESGDRSTRPPSTPPP